MKRTIIFLIGFNISVFCMAQTPLAREYSYDAAGNRTACAVIDLSPALSPPVPPPPPDSTAEEPGSVETQCIASLQLYNPSGQLLQEHPVHSATTVVSLAGLAKGIYILKVSVNGKTEEWKIIKN